MSDPTISAAPVPIAGSDSWSLSGIGALVRGIKRITDWITGLSPAGSPVYATGWVSLTPASGTSSGGFGIRRDGMAIFMRGAVSPASNWGTAGTAVTVVAAGGIPSQFRPTQAQRFLCSGVSTGVFFSVVLGSDGSLVVQCSASTSTTSCWFSNVQTALG